MHSTTAQNYFLEHYFHIKLGESYYCCYIESLTAYCTTKYSSCANNLNLITNNYTVHLLQVLYGTITTKMF